MAMIILGSFNNFVMGKGFVQEQVFRSWVGTELHYFVISLNQASTENGIIYLRSHATNPQTSSPNIAHPFTAQITIFFD
jgi:hypothetical protein